MIGNLPYIHIIDAELVAPCQKEFLTSRHGIIFLYCPYTYIMVTIYDYQILLHHLMPKRHQIHFIFLTGYILCRFRSIQTQTVILDAFRLTRLFTTLFEAKQARSCMLGTLFSNKAIYYTL